MKKTSCEITLKNFYENMSWGIDFLMKIEKSRRVVKERYEKRDVFEAFVFRICANWEILMQDLLIDCFSKDTSKYKDFTGFDVPKHLSLETCKAIILGTGYLDFKSISDLKMQTKRILVPACNPFEKIPKFKGDKIDEFFTIRNYLSHYSDAARRKLDKLYKDKYNLHRFIEPGQFLLAKRSQNELPRMGEYINNFVECVDKMAEFLGINIEE